MRGSDCETAKAGAMNRQAIALGLMMLQANLVSCELPLAATKVFGSW